jgi:plastocyanin
MLRGHRPFAAAVLLVALCGAAAAVGAPRPQRPAKHHHGRHHRLHIGKPGPTSTTPAVTQPTPASTGTGTTTTSTTPPPALPNHLLVQEAEYRVIPSHDPVAAGPLQFNVANQGMDAHNLTIVGDDGNIIAQTAVLDPGSSVTLSATLPAGTYTLECTLYNHASLGMRTTLTVQ